MAAFVFAINLGMVENLLATIEALKSPSARLVDKFPYRNQRNVWELCFVIWHAGQYHMLSVSNCHNTEPTLIDLASSLSGVRHMDADLCGFYDNKKGLLGYYATFQSTWTFDNADHWYMLARSNDRKTLYRMRYSENLAQDLSDLIDYLEARDTV